MSAHGALFATTSHALSPRVLTLLVTLADLAHGTPLALHQHVHQSVGAAAAAAAANGGCRSARVAKTGEIAALGCRPRSRAMQPAHRTSPGWSRRCCSTTLSVRVKSITGQSSSAFRLVQNIAPAHAGK